MHNFHYKDSDFFLFHLKEDIPIPDEFTPNTHPQRAELLCFISGKCKYKIEDGIFALHPGDLILIPPNAIHQIEVDPSVPYERICINFRPEVLSPFDSNGALLQPFSDRSIYGRKVFRVSDFEQFVCAERFYDMMEPTPDRHTTILANMILIMQKISMVYLSTDQSETAYVNTEQELINYINRHLEQELTTDTLCKQFYLSRAQLCRIFKGATGTSVGKFITAKRMVKAQKMIVQGYKPSSVFHECGYQNYSSFFRAYCKFFGHSPKEDARNSATGIPFSSISIG